MDNFISPILSFLSHHKTHLCDHRKQERKRYKGDRVSLLGYCLLILRLGISEPFIPPLVPWTTWALNSTYLTANERKGRKISNVLLKAHSLALGSHPVPLWSYLDQWENSSRLLLSIKMVSTPRRDTGLFLCEIKKYGSFVPTLNNQLCVGTNFLFTS